MLFCRLLIFFKLFFLNLQEIPLECPTIWNQIRQDILKCRNTVYIKTVNTNYDQQMRRSKDLKIYVVKWFLTENSIYYQ